MPQYESRRLTHNNFDLLRLLFAGTVCLVHAYELSGFQQLSVVAGALSSATAVKAFFVVSGFLIFMSCERSSTLASYAGKRIRRIYPAYFAVVMLCAIGLVAVTTKSAGDYYSLAWIKYIVANLSFLNFFQYTLPGVFESNRLTVVNGALWTLKIEVMFYVSVPFFIYLFKKLGRLPVIVLVYCSSVAYEVLLVQMAERTGSGIYLALARQLPGQLSYFMAGAFFYYYLLLFERRIGYFLVLATVLLAVDALYPLALLQPFALATLIIFFGLFLYTGNFGKYGDYSYGIYILHFPIIQLLLYGGWFQDQPWYFLSAVILVTGTAAMAMWHLVEKRFLLRSNHYVATAGGELAPDGRNNGYG